MTKGKFVWKKISPSQLVPFGNFVDRGKPIVWDEGKDELYVVDYSSIIETLKEFDRNPNIQIIDTAYFKFWEPRKGAGYCAPRIKQMFETYESMKLEFQRDLGANGGICVEQTGEKLDGMHRALIAYHLGIKEIEIKEYAFNWREVDEDFLRRKVRARELSFGPCYYSIDYGGFKSLEQAHSKNYEENTADRWNSVLVNLINPTTILDLGCNEGYNSIQCTLLGAKVTGVDISFIAGAYLDKLIFEWKHHRDLDITFIQQKIEEYEPEPVDTVLMLNVIYHLPQELQIPILKRLKAKRVILQGNLRKLSEHDRFRGITVEDMIFLLNSAGWSKTQVVAWRDKPIVIGYEKT